MKWNDCNTEAIISNEYSDLLMFYRNNLEELLNTYNPACYQIISRDLVILHLKRDKTVEEIFTEGTLYEIPNLLGPCARESLDSTGISYFHERPGIVLTGQGILIGIIDSGIDYTNDSFIYEDNTRKILRIWDKIQPGTPPEGFLYGTEYSQEAINLALQNNNPFDIVPEKDETGHGTFLAGLAAGRYNLDNNFIGAAQDAELLVVKLKQAKGYIRDFYFVDPLTTAYQDTDVIMGIKYLQMTAKMMNRPLVIILGLGNNIDTHDGSSALEQYINEVSLSAGMGIVIAAGNEADKAHHYYYQFMNGIFYQDIEVRVAENEPGFILFIVANEPDEISVSALSPAGDFSGRLALNFRRGENISFILEGSDLQIRYVYSFLQTGDEIILLRFIRPSTGIWVVRVYGDLLVDGRIDAWLPNEGFVKPGTEFLEPDPFTTVTVPATGADPISVGAYNHLTGTLYRASGRGLTRNNVLKPTLTAPGINILGPLPGNTFGTMTGTSIAAAYTAGAVALLFEWGIVLGNNPGINNVEAKIYLMRGARRREGIIYPNREWGYGELDLIGTFNTLLGIS